MISQSEQLRHFSSNYLNLIILPTEACNFRCTYCYETFENKKMPRPVVTGIKSLIDRRGEDLDRLDISWFGGEPLLALDVITEISKHALDVAKTEGFTFSSGMTTNGYFLNQDRFSQVNHKIDFFQISLDGNPDDHNASRKLASGGGTFDRDMVESDRHEGHTRRVRRAIEIALYDVELYLRRPIRAANSRRIR